MKSLKAKKLHLIEQRITRLQGLKNRLDETSEPYISKRLKVELKKEAVAVSNDVRDYIQGGGDAEKIADFYRNG